MQQTPHYYHGPERHPLIKTEEGFGLEGGGRPFFGIAPLGWVQQRTTHPAEGATLWNLHAAMLDRGVRAADEVLPTSELDTIQARSLAFVREVGAVDFSTSAMIATQAARQVWPKTEFGDDKLALWCVREGQISSVWRCDRVGESGELESIAVNVARDTIAGVVLERSGKLLATCTTGAVAHVRACFSIPNGAASVVCLVQDWVPYAMEMGFARQADGDLGLVAIERFLCDDPASARLTGVLAHRLPSSAWTEVLEVLALLSRPMQGKQGIEIPEIAIGRGDFVHTPRGPVLVACSGRWHPLPNGSETTLHKVIDGYLKTTGHQSVAYTVA